MKRDGKYVLIILAVWVLGMMLFPLPRPKNNPLSGPSGGKKQTAGLPECLALKVWYDSYNTEYFFDTLPKDTLVQYGNPGLPNAMATTRKIAGRFVITLDKKYTLAPKVAHESILHESCHIVAWMELEDHGRKWHECMENLNRKGAFSEIW